MARAPFDLGIVLAMANTAGAFNYLDRRGVTVAASIVTNTTPLVSSAFRLDLGTAPVFSCGGALAAGKSCTVSLTMKRPDLDGVTWIATPVPLTRLDTTLAPTAMSHSITAAQLAAGTAFTLGTGFVPRGELYLTAAWGATPGTSDAFFVGVSG